ncbi:questin oxidase family protein [Streptomyces rectiverticillatus]|uniref:questin oxidase family protein n=1 Tax=Streptomyces rectiverticillatus TaxID=173860 RepID=UPI0015C364A4|nr:questin oxidase family protein [Streptomyces rectiverticillatus]QLE70564.1 questin oxidase family protein [Streptomyces rectiverticillatus]
MTSISYSDALNDALERMDDLGYERGQGVDLANHGPMGAEALALLGQEGEVARWVVRYRKAMEHHEPPAARFALDPADESSWRPALGAFDRAGDWERLFARELADAHWREVLARWWPRLIPGLFAGLTHGLIRTAHAVRGLYAAAGNATPLQLNELARGLAYWAARYAELPGHPRLGGSYDLHAAVAALPRVAPDGPMGPGAVRRRLDTLDRLPGYDESLGRLAQEQAPRLLSEMTLQFADVYLGHPEVFPVPLIHGVTAPAAVRIVLPHLPHELHEPTLARLWQVHTAFLLAFTTDRREEGTDAWRSEARDLPPLDELGARAAEHGDEHVIKFTEACLREYALRPDPRYPAAAYAAQRRITRLDDGGAVRNL